MDATTRQRISSLGGKAVVKKYGKTYMAELGHKGLEGLAKKYFQGDKQAALEWLGQCGAYAYDAQFRERGWGVMPEPPKLKGEENVS